LEKAAREGVSQEEMVQETVQDETTQEKASRQPKSKRYYFLHEMVKQTTDKKKIREETTNLLLAGRDTTAGLLSNMLFELARRPEI